MSGINVNVEELRKYGRDAHARGDDTTKVADNVSQVHVGPDVLGLINAGNVNDLIADQNQIVAKARAIAAALAEDGTTADTNATEYEHTEAEHASRFRNTELP